MVAMLHSHRAAKDREGWRHRERMPKNCCTSEDYWTVFRRFLL